MLISNANSFFFSRGWRRGGRGVSGTCCREHARGWMTGFLPPSSSSSCASGTRPLSLPPLESCSMSVALAHTPRRSFDGCRGKEVDEEEREEELERPFSSVSQCVSARPVEASRFSITKGGEERGRNRGRRRRR